MGFLEDFCIAAQSQIESDDWKGLPVTSLEFLQNLGLPAMHPFCSHPNETLIRPLSPPMGPPSMFKTGTSLKCITAAFWYYIPPLWALLYLILNVLAIWGAPLGILLLWNQVFSAHKKIDAKSTSIGKIRTELTLYATFFFAWLLFTDDQYVLAMGRFSGACFLLITSALGVCLDQCGKCHQRMRFRFMLVFTCCVVFFPWWLLNPDDVPQIMPGLYFNEKNEVLQSILKGWEVPEYHRLATPWQWIGDATTGLPYLMNYPSAPSFHRLWMATEDSEFIALDIAFPPNGHDTMRPLYLVLHGLNGGSQEGYVMDLAASRVRDGSTVVVMVARGLMDTPIQGLSLFHGIRTSDVHLVASLLRKRVLAENQTFAGVGYSMGAIVLNRYVFTHPEVSLDASVSISGALNTLYQKDYQRSKRTWQRLLAAYMKGNFRGKWGERIHSILGEKDYKNLLEASNVVGIDEFVGVKWNGYESLTDFYTEMSSILAYSSTLTDSKMTQRKVSIPHLILQSLDDPISTWRSNVSNDPKSNLYPTKLVATGHQDNLVILLTEKGGHVGWPVFWWPSSWFFMNDLVAANFISAFDKYIHADHLLN